MRTARFVCLLAVHFLLASGVAGAGPVYQIRSIVRLGDKIGSPPIHTRTGLWVGSLNDNDQIAFVTGNAAGGPVLFLYSGGAFTPIVAAGQAVPGGRLTQVMEVGSPVSMNQAGALAFSLLDSQTNAPLGSFMWDPKTRQITSIVSKGTPAGSVTLLDAGGSPPAITNHNDVAFVADVKSASGEIQSGVFLLRRDGLVPVAVPDQALPDGSQIQSASEASANDTGAVAFLATRKGDRSASAYVWSNGAITSVAGPGTALNATDKIAGVWGAWVNNKNSNVLLEVNVKSVTAAHSLYLFTGGTLVPVAVAGQAIGGETLKAVTGGVSTANDAGQHAFLATLSASTAAYLMNADGGVSLILKSSPSTQAGAIARVGEASTFGVSLNNNGQIAVVVRFSGAASSTLVLLTPQ